jgi:hypothetical protein
MARLETTRTRSPGCTGTWPAFSVISDGLRHAGQAAFIRGILLRGR